MHSWPGSLITSRPSCLNFIGFPFVSVLSTNCWWRSTSACTHEMTPPCLAVDCVPVTSLPGRRHLRSAESGCLAITGARTTLGSRNFTVAGAKIWNSLPVDLRFFSQSLRTFGHNLKQYLFVNKPWAHLRFFFKFALYKFSQYYYYCCCLHALCIKNAVEYTIFRRENSFFAKTA